MKSDRSLQKSTATRTVAPSTQKGGNVMNNHFTNIYLYRWMLALTAAGFLALPLLGSGGLKEQFTPLAAVEEETDWTLANAIEVGEEEVDWTLA